MESSLDRGLGRRGALEHPGEDPQVVAQVSTSETRYPEMPFSTCRGMPPTAPPMNGRAFHSASLTVSPKPSRVDFWTTTSACDWNALTSIAPTLLKLLRM